MRWTRELETARRAIAATHPSPDISERAGRLCFAVGVTLTKPQADAVGAFRARFKGYAVERDFTRALQCAC